LAQSLSSVNDQAGVTAAVRATAGAEVSVKTEGSSTANLTGASTLERASRRGRDHRIDLVRGLALAMIFINHMPGNWMGQWTSRNFGFSDAAELFVLLAGYSAAMAYHSHVATNDHWGVMLKASRRAGVLYCAHIVTTAAALILFLAAMTASEHAQRADLIGVAPIFIDPAAGLLAVLIGGCQLSYFNILPMYVVLLALLPAMFWLAARDKRLLLAVSGVAYLTTNLAGLTLPSSRNYESWFFNPMAWQLLFAVGVTVGLCQREGREIRFHRGLFWAAVAYLGFSAAWMTGGLGSRIGDGALPDWLASMYKPNLPVPRLLHVLALAYVVCHCPIWAWLARIPKDFVLTRMGRHSLPVFMTGSLLSMAGWILANESNGGVLVETAVVIVGMAVMATLALWLEKEHAVQAISLRRRAASAAVSSASRVP
jgi:hypothetical protein